MKMPEKEKEYMTHVDSLRYIGENLMWNADYREQAQADVEAVLRILKGWKV